MVLPRSRRRRLFCPGRRWPLFVVLGVAGFLCGGILFGSPWLSEELVVGVDATMWSNVTSTGKEWGRDNVKAAHTSGQASSDKTIVVPPARQLQIQNCRWFLESWLHPQISLWLAHELPILDWVFELPKKKYMVMLITIHLDPQTTEVPFRRQNWNCFDSQGNVRKAKVLQQWGKTYLASQRLLVVCHNLPGTLVAVWPDTIVANQFAASVPSSDTLGFYNVTPHLECDRLETTAAATTKANKIGACLRIRGMPHLLEPWIRYHRYLGVNQFWIFVNQATHNTTDLSSLYLSTPLDGITWIPYPFHAQDFIEDTPPQSYGRSSIQRHVKHFWQSTTQMQCLYHFKRLGLEWMVTLDVDEYVWVSPASQTQQPKDLLKEFLNQYSNDTELGALTMWSIPFGSSQVPPPKRQRLLTPNTSSTFLLDYIHRRPFFSIRRGIMDRQKLWYHVPVATDVTIHALRHGGREQVVPMDVMRIQHYKEPHWGVFQATSVEELETDASLRNLYYEQVLQENNR